MNPEPSLSDRIQTLAEAHSRAERQLRRLEGRLRIWQYAAMLTTALFFLSLGVVSGVAISAQDPAAASGTAPGPADPKKPFRPVRAGLDDLHNVIEREREKMARSNELDPAHAIAIFLYDVKEAMAVMPDIASDMKEMNAKMGAVPVMAAEMQQMKVQMGIMSRSVNSTMGRMGSMFPWMP